MRRLSLAALAVLAATAALPARAAPDDQPLQTPDRAHQATAGVAAAAPMYDMNLMRQKIPPLLIAVMADPYARPPSLDCASLAYQVSALDQVLGDDYDAPRPEETREAKRARQARAGLHAGSAALLPFGGIIRTLSGAAKHDRKVLDAVMSGRARRSYLKGIGEARGCPAPARAIHATRTAQGVPAR